MITLEQIKNIAKDIKEDKEWVNDSHTFSEHKGVVSGLDGLVRHLKELQANNVSIATSPIPSELNWWRIYGEYVSRVHNNIDAEACGYADGDEEYEENFNQNADQL